MNTDNKEQQEWKAIPIAEFKPESAMIYPVLVGGKIPMVLQYIADVPFGKWSTVHFEGGKEIKQGLTHILMPVTAEPASCPSCDMYGINECPDHNPNFFEGQQEKQGEEMTSEESNFFINHSDEIIEDLKEQIATLTDQLNEAQQENGFLQMRIKELEKANRELEEEKSGDIWLTGRSEKFYLDKVEKLQSQLAALQSSRVKDVEDAWDAGIKELLSNLIVFHVTDEMLHKKAAYLKSLIEGTNTGLTDKK